MPYNVVSIGSKQELTQPVGAGHCFWCHSTDNDCRVNETGCVSPHVLSYSGLLCVDCTSRSKDYWTVSCKLGSVLCYGRGVPVFVEACVFAFECRSAEDG